MRRMFSNSPGDWGSIPDWVIPTTQKWYLMPPCLGLSIIRYRSRVKWCNPGNRVASSLTHRLLKMGAFGSPSAKVTNFTFYLLVGDKSNLKNMIGTIITNLLIGSGLSDYLSSQVRAKVDCCKLLEGFGCRVKVWSETRIPEALRVTTQKMASWGWETYPFTEVQSAYFAAAAGLLGANEDI